MINQEIYVNPAKGRQYNPDDFAGILAKYESDVKVQYLIKNMDVQYPLTIIRTSLKSAFVSWEELDRYISSLTQSLYNGLYNDEYNYTKMLVGSAYNNNHVALELIANPTTSEEIAKEFVTKARSYYLNFQVNSGDYNGWKKAGGSGRPIITRTRPEDIILLIRNDIRSYIDVNVLASAFQLTSSEFLASNIYPIDTFSVFDYDEYGNKIEIFDGSNIIAMICDRRWFKIRPQEQYMESQRNANNRSMQYYLNCIKMYEYSLFANAVCFITEEPQIALTSMQFPQNLVTLTPNITKYISVETNPANSTSEITFTTENEDVISIEKTGSKTVKITPLKEGQAIVTATSNGISTTTNIVISENIISISNINFGTQNVTVNEGETETIDVSITPNNGTQTILYTSSNESIFTVEKINNTQISITGVATGVSTLIATTGSVTTLLNVEITAKS